MWSLITQRRHSRQSDRRIVHQRFFPHRALNVHFSTRSRLQCLLCWRSVSGVTVVRLKQWDEINIRFMSESWTTASGKTRVRCHADFNNWYRFIRADNPIQITEKEGSHFLQLYTSSPLHLCCRFRFFTVYRLLIGREAASEPKQHIEYWPRWSATPMINKL